MFILYKVLNPLIKLELGVEEEISWKNWTDPKVQFGFKIKKKDWFIWKKLENMKKNTV